MQSDPIGLIAGANLFDYVGNKPLNRRDDFGLIAVPPGLLIPTAVKRPSFGPKTDAVLATRSGGSCELCKEGFGAPGSGKGPERHHVPGNEWAPMRDAALLLICATPDLGLQKILVKALRAAFRDPNGLKVLCENCHDDSHGNERRYGN